MNQSSLSTLIAPVVTISRCDRWQACQRLQDLQVSCQCSADGGLQVEVNHAIDILQLRSVIQQMTATRSDLVEWLQRCWQTPGSSPNH